MWKIPEPITVHKFRLDENTVTSLRQHGNPSGPRLVLCHGNGLSIDLYYPFWSLLAEDFDLILYDLRNHGWNKVGIQREHNIPVLMQDYALILESIDHYFGSKPKIGVFHSISALITLLSSPQVNSCVAQILFDPPVCKPGASQVELDAATEHAAEMTRRRGYRFKTEEEFSEFLSYMPTFTRVVPGVLQLMARTTLRRASNGQDYVLRCPREYEAQIMDYVRSFSPLVDFTTLPCPTKVIGADPTLPYSYLPSFDLSSIMTLDYDFMPDATHLLQLEKPAECVEVVHQFVAQNRLA